MKIDDNSVYLLCNSLNAISGLWPELPHVRLHILKAQEMITVLYEENKKLKREDDNPGRWLWVPYDSSNPELGFFTCSNCGFQPAHFNMAKHHLKYCPDCGKKMEVK